ncbi:glycosyltransferase family 2 protein [Polaribacter sp. HL-MS24]|uniref:glycosyltransferase family 2 protein n=1 Tax=Polaribacter sp. HL-MS24 TaxID=3077735 RepID=UPI002934CC1A|nr:glycosyltransferase family 2 protein [Polaribacter sp. HL-MS24]WOC39249.1 glycosyltransferase family 2 protein [Polaribacter sp. HL-MS24]
MVYEYDITATIVLYHEDLDVLQKTVDSFLKIPFKKRLFLVDNSATDVLKKSFPQEEITYIFTGKNIGFGAAHNLVLNHINSNYHLVLNPDVAFEEAVLPVLIRQLEMDKELALISPKVMYPSGEHQFVCRTYPTLFDLINRRFKFSKNAILKHEYRTQDLSQPFYPDFIHGCFLVFKTSIFKDLNGFDERYFLYMEDVDICKKIDAIGKKKLYYPKVEIEHILKRGSSKNFHLLILHISSAIKYFFKWGFSKNNTGS